MTRRPQMYLVLRNGSTGEAYASYPVEPGDHFAIGFLHSVHKNPLVDLYEIAEDGTIYAEETIYYSFGAGVQTDLNPGEVMSFGEDGAIIVSNIHKPFQKLTYCVGTVSDHTLVMGDMMPIYYDQVKQKIGIFTEDKEALLEGGVRVISLSNLCGRNSIVSFCCEERLF